MYKWSVLWHLNVLAPTHTMHAERGQGTNPRPSISKSVAMLNATGLRVKASLGIARGKAKPKCCGQNLGAFQASDWAPDLCKGLCSFARRSARKTEHDQLPRHMLNAVSWDRFTETGIKQLHVLSPVHVPTDRYPQDLFGCQVSHNQNLVLKWSTQNYVKD